MAVKIARQPNKICLLGAPTSAAAISGGREGAPPALRAAGLVQKLKSAGYDVVDLGDDAPRVFKLDEESPRARNTPGVIAALETLKPRIEQAAKSGALPLILGGDCSIALATVAGLRRYFRNVSLIYMDRDADFSTPAITTTGAVDGMVVSHLTGRGAAELVRFWSEPPLVREPDLVLFGVDRLDPSEEAALLKTAIRQYSAADVERIGAAAAAQAAVDHIHLSEFVVHLDVDVIADFQATDEPGSGGLSLEQVRNALEVFTGQRHLIAIEVTGYNPAKDTDGRGASLILDLISGVLDKRLTVLRSEEPPTSSEGSPAATSRPVEPTPGTAGSLRGESDPVSAAPVAVASEKTSSSQAPEEEAESPDSAYGSGDSGAPTPRNGAGESGA